MTLEIPQGFGQVAFKYALTGDNEEMVTTVGYDFDTAGGDYAATLANLRDQWLAGWVGAYVGWTFLGCTARVATNTGIIIVEAPAAAVGAAVGETPPQNCALLVKKSTQIAGRSGRGRMFIPPFALAEGAIAKNGVIGALEHADIQGLIDLALPVADNFYLLHDVAADLAPSRITGFTLDHTIATQRRRLR